MQDDSDEKFSRQTASSICQICVPNLQTCKSCIVRGNFLVINQSKEEPVHCSMAILHKEILSSVWSHSFPVGLLRWRVPLFRIIIITILKVGQIYSFATVSYHIHKRYHRGFLNVYSNMLHVSILFRILISWSILILSVFNCFCK